MWYKEISQFLICIIFKKYNTDKCLFGKYMNKKCTMNMYIYIYKYIIIYKDFILVMFIYKF